MDIISDSITKIRNAQKSKQDAVQIKGNSLLSKICGILVSSGFIDSYKEKKEKGKYFIDLKLKYDKLGKPVISNLTRISKLSRRMYSGAQDLPRIANGFATIIVSTSKGVMTGKEAKEKNVGGEVIFYVI